VNLGNRKELSHTHEDDRGAGRDVDDRGRVIALAAPRRHSLLWRFSPEGYRRTMEEFAERPTQTRLLAAAEVGLGLWLALRQYSKE
jgi:hypothetical protein